MLVGSLVFHALSMLSLLIRQCWPTGAWHINQLEQKMARMDESETSNRAMEQLKHFFGDDVVKSDIKEDR